MTFFSVFLTFAHKLMLIFVGLIGIGLVIGFHELGHFIFCKIFNIRTPSFSIGFGPRLFEKKIGETVFALSALPLGGYVEIAGAQEVGQGEQKEAQSSDSRSFSSKPYYQKLLVMCGGILFNIIFTYIILTFLFTTGLPDSQTLYPYNAIPIITSIQPDSPAAQAGILLDDEIIALNGQPLNNQVSRFHELMNATTTSPVTLTLVRTGAHLTVPVTPTSGQTQRTIGVSFKRTALSGRSVSQGLRDALLLTKQWLVNTYNSFKAMITGKTKQGLNGPLMIVSETSKSAQKGIKSLFVLLAFISVQLAILNLIPLPILDGGQILFYTIEAIIGRPLPEYIRLTIHYICWAGLLALLVYITIKDCKNIFFK